MADGRRAVMSRLDGRMTVEDYLAWYFGEVNDDVDLRVELVSGTVYDEPPVPWSHADAAHRTYDHLRTTEPHVYMGATVWVDDWSMWNPRVTVLNGPLGGDETYIAAADVKLMVDVCDEGALVHTSLKVAIAGYANVPEYWIVNPGFGRIWRFRSPEELNIGRAYSSVEQLPWPAVLGDGL
jgi:Uma2 family endonuclease